MEIPTDNTRKPQTEKALIQALKNKGIPENCITTNVQLNNCPFNKSKKYKPDLSIVSRSGDKIYIEVKGHMDCRAIRILYYLLFHSSHMIHLVQLTDYDWIVPYKKQTHGTKRQKSRTDFETQVNELFEFYEDSISSTDLKNRSRKRLKDYLSFQNSVYMNWCRKINDYTSNTENS